MAITSNINNKFVVEQTTGYVGVGTTDPDYLLHLNSTDTTNGTRLAIQNNNTNGKIYGLISDNTGLFSLRDLTAGADRLTISTGGDVTFQKSITVGTGNSSIAGDLYFGVNADIFKNSGTLKISTVEGIEYQVRSGNGSSGDHVFKSYNTAILTLNGATNNSTFAGTVIAPNYQGPGQGLDNLLPLGVYSTVPGTAGVLIKTNIVSNNYAFLFGTIKLEQFNQSTKQTIEFSATVSTNGTVATKAATADVAITIKLFNVGGYWYIHLPMPSTYVTVSAYIYTGSGYQGQGKGFNEVSSIAMNPVPASPVGSVDIVANVYLTTGTSSPWFKNGNDIYNSNSANVGIGTTGAAKNRLEVKGLFAAPLTTGSVQNGIARFSQTSGNGSLDIGFGDPYSWIQSRSSASYAANYNLALQPNGANVGIGTTSPGSQLEIKAPNTSGSAARTVVTRQLTLNANGGNNLQPYEGFGTGIIFEGYDYAGGGSGTSGPRDYAYIDSIIENSGSSPVDFRSQLKFHTNPGGSNTQTPTVKMVITSAGQIQTPQNPAFRARAKTSQSYAAGWQKILYSESVTTRGTGYASSRFTAPVDGWYQFNAQWTANDNTDIDGTFSLWINGSSTNLAGSVSQPSTGSAYDGHVVSGCCYLAATHYVEVYRYSSIVNETRTSNPYGGWFSGFLIG